MKAYIQFDYRSTAYPSPALPGATVASGGCGPCCAAMIAEGLTGEAFPPEEAAALAMSCGARVAGGTDMLALGRALAKKFPLSLTVSDDLRALLDCLDAGGMAAANTAGDAPGRVGLFSDGGHYVAAAEHSGGCLTVLDPGYYEGKFTLAGRAGRALPVGRGIVTCSPEALHQDCAGRSPRYYLFERKGRPVEKKPDNSPALWEKEAVEWALEKGLIRGDERGDLALHSPVTAARLCVLLRRLYQTGEK